MSRMDFDFMQGKVASIRVKVEGTLSMARELDSVTIRFPFEIAVLPESGGATWICLGVDVDMFAVDPNVGERLLCRGRIDESIQSRTSHYQRDHLVSFRCSPRAVAEYERLRDGGPVKLRVKANAQLHGLERTAGHRAAICEPRAAFGQEDFQVDQAKWVAALRSARLTTSLLIEIPLPTDGEIDDEALTALSNALASFDNGGSTAWKDSIGHLRPFLENWRSVSETPKIEPRDGSPSDREWKLLNARDALYKCCHFWVHEGAAQCSRYYAIFMLSSFAGLLKSYRTRR
jgi:hypothetical protein